MAVHAHQLRDYLDMQAQVGITKHLGGYPATRMLLNRCHVATARQVLYVGAGIGVGPAYIARTYGGHVTAIDISAQMIAWSLLRAYEEGVADRIDLQVADVCDLPFASDSFDALICESVLGFVDDKAAAIASCIRVIRPGGYIGLNETLWVTEPPPNIVTQVRNFGAIVPSAADWQALWDNSGLTERVVTLHKIEPREEIRQRIEWVGWRWAVRAWRRLCRMYMSNPATRASVAEQFGSGMGVTPYMGYGLLSGRKA